MTQTNIKTETNKIYCLFKTQPTTGSHNEYDFLHLEVRLRHIHGIWTERDYFSRGQGQRLVRSSDDCDSCGKHLLSRLPAK